MPSVQVIGFGSIGGRHARLCRERGLDVSVVTRRTDVCDYPCFRMVADGLAARPDYFILANETAAHWPALMEISRHVPGATVLVEKPLAATLPDAAELEAVRASGLKVRLAYNLRFHPAIQRLKQALAGKPVVNFCAYAGQDLRTWRPGQDVSAGYSADPSQGGGVLRDLSHELDYVNWLLGDWTRLTAIGGRVGPLPIRSDDCWSLLLATALAPVVSVQLDYYNRPGARTVVVNTGEETIAVDLVRHTWRDASGETSWTVDRDFTYRAQLEALLGGEGAESLCTLEEGVEVMRTIAAAESAALSNVWVSR